MSNAVFTVFEPDDINPDYPVRFDLEVYDDAPDILRQTQPGPFLTNTEAEMFIRLETLVELGAIAETILRARQNRETK